MERAELETVLAGWKESRKNEALGELLKAYRDRAYSIALRITGSGADAEDAVQEAFLKLLTRTHGLDDLAEFERSVCRAVIQCGLDGLKKRRRRGAREVPLAQPEGAAHVTDGGAQETAGEREELLTLLRGGVAELPDDERIPVVLCYGQGMSVPDAARTLELPRETVRARLKRALASLKAFFKRRGREASAVLLLGLLWQDGAHAAPSSLCAALDHALPGRPCAEVGAAPRFGPAATAVPGASGTLALGGMAAALLIVTLALTLGPAGGQPEVPVKQAAAVEVPRGTSERSVEKQGPEESSPVREQEQEKETTNMNRKFAALALSSALLVPGAVMAGDADPNAAAVIQKIEARRAEKAAAAQKAAEAAAAAAARTGSGVNSPGQQGGQ